MEDHVAISMENTTNTTSEKNLSPSPSPTADSSGENGTHTSNKTEKGIICLGNVLYFIINIIAIIALLVITTIIVIPVLPLMLSFYYIALIVQAFRSDDDNQVGTLMGSLAQWLWKFFALISVDLILCELIFGVTPSLKHRTFHGVSITRCIGVLVIICVFLTYSMLLRYYLGNRRLRRKHGEETVHLYEGIIGAINSLFYLFALFLIIRIAPILKEHAIFGLPTQKWVTMIILLVLGHFAVRIFTSAIVVSIREMRNNNRSKRMTQLCNQVTSIGKTLLAYVETLTGKPPRTELTKYIVYYAEGLRMSFNFVLTSLLVLLTWILYFGSRLQRSSSDTVRVVYDFCLWTFACVLGSAFLWTVKRVIILRWKARVVYDRLNGHISHAAIPLYLISVILDIWDEKREAKLGDLVKGKDEPNATTKCLEAKHQSHDEEGKKTGENRTNNQDPGKETNEGSMKGENESANREREGKSEEATEAITGETEKNQKKDTSDTARMARYFMDAEESLSKDSYVAEFVAELREENTGTGSQKIQVPTLRGRNLTEGDRKHLDDQLVKNYKLEDLEKWIMENHKNCLKLGRTIAGAMEAANCLDNIMIGVLVAVVFIVWLLLTELATTRVLVLIASPIVGANFIFGPSCSTLFQGIMFAYVMHPFDVGDVCTIEEIQLEVKRIGVWKIIFSKVGATDDVVYSTTALANIRIINHKGELDSNNKVERKSQSTATKSKEEPDTTESTNTPSPGSAGSERNS